MLNFELLSREDIIITFPTEKSCLIHLENLRWKGEIISPFDKISKVYSCKNNRYRCRNSGKYFNVKTNTVFHNSRIPLQKWFIAVWIVSNGKQKITSVGMSKEINITQKTAWFMLQRIKKFLEINKGFEATKPTEKKEISKKIKLVVQATKIAEVATASEKLKMSDWLVLLKKQ